MGPNAVGPISPSAKYGAARELRDAAVAIGWLKTRFACKLQIRTGVARRPHGIGPVRPFLLAGGMDLPLWTVFGGHTEGMHVSASHDPRDPGVPTHLSARRDSSVGLRHGTARHVDE